VKDHSEIYHYFLAENETKNTHSPQENTSNDNNHSHEWSVQDEFQKENASQCEEDNSDKFAQASED
jgi:hypothetical protein